MRARYLPAILPATVQDKPGLRPLHPLDPRTRGTGAYHAEVVCSVYHWRSVGTLPKSATVVADSGGFQLLTLGADLDPRPVLVWQLRHAHRGPVLDLPPVSDLGRAPKDPERRFRYCLRVTVANVLDALPLYAQAHEAGSGFRWLGVVHGATWAELAEWYDRLADVYPFDRRGEGWCFRPDPQGSPEAVARVVAFARSRGLQRIHVFVPGGPAAVGSLLALARAAGIDRLTWDNSSPLTSGWNHRTLYRRKPHGLGWRTVATTEGRDRRALDYMLERCPCTSCRWYAEDVQAAPRRAGAEGYLRRRMAFHNLLAVRAIYRNLNRAARRDPTGLLAELLGPDGAWKVRAVFEGEGGHG